MRPKNPASAAFFMIVAIFGINSVSVSVLGIREQKLGSFLVEETVTRTMFPTDFLWGTSSSSFQIEGAWNESGKGPGIWDIWSLTPGHIMDNSTAELSNDHYHQYAEDSKLLSSIGLKSYRFSISWSRIFPRGDNTINLEGVDFYNRLINSLLSEGITPFATLHHFDTPQALDDEFNGWLSEKMIDAFVQFSDTCFALFGDRVKYWITLNEPAAQAGGGWGSDGHFPPGRCTNRTLCASGNSGVEPYLVVHHMLQGHGKVAELYNNKYKKSQKGAIGIALVALWYEPAGYSDEYKEAAEICLQFQISWILDPIFKGGYPASMQERVGDRLPSFSTEDLVRLNQSIDFVGLNHYLVEWASPSVAPTDDLASPTTDRWVTIVDEAPSVFPGAENMIPFSPTCAFGMRKIVEWTTAAYPNLDIYITENGYEESDSVTSLSVALEDKSRIEYFKAYLLELSTVVRNGAPVRGYFAWSFMDSFEWNFGFSLRYGIFYVDRQTLQRTPKKSAIWWTNFLSVKDKTIR